MADIQETNHFKESLNLLRKKTAYKINSAGKSWKEFWDKPMTVQYAYSPYEVVGNGGKPNETTQRRGDIAKETVAAASAPAIMIGAATAGVPATIGGLAFGAGGTYVGNKIGQRVGNILGTDENGTELLGDAGGFIGGSVGARTGMTAKSNIISNVRNFAKSPEGKRAAEILMRTNVETNPVRSVLYTFSKKGRNYIKNGGEYPLPNTYTGGKGVDMVDTYIYGKPLDPRYFIESSDFGPHTDYVSKFYPTSRVKAYEIKPEFAYRMRGIQEPLASASGVSKTPTKLQTKGIEGNIRLDNTHIGDMSIDTAGHLLQKGTVTNSSGFPIDVIRQQDIWKFNPNEYVKKYFRLTPVLQKLGLHFLDAAGTPVIVRTPWQFYNPNLLSSYSNLRFKHGGSLNYLSYLKSGGSIHIKPENKGKFTEYCGGNVTDKCIQKAKHSGNKKLIKRAVFAENARKWN